MKDMSKFQIILIAVFIVGILGAVIIFATTKAKDAVQSTQVTAWGLLDAFSFTRTIETINASAAPEAKVNIRYEQKDPTTFHTEILEAIADGRAPDIIVLPQDFIFKYLKRIALIPYQVYTERLFSDSFVEGTELYKVTGGLTALPLTVDPIVMYWNRDIFNRASISLPPKTWDEFPFLAKVLTVKDNTLRIEQSFAALGEYYNVDHAKDIISLMALQRGETITGWGGFGVETTLNVVNFESVLSFYTSFSDPSRETYSWNRSLPSAKEYFLLGKLAVYFGYASEAGEIRRKNPNLNFDVSQVPDFKDATKKVTYGKMYGLAVLRTSRNVNQAVQNIINMTGDLGGKTWSEFSGWPSVRRGLLVSRPPDKFGSILFDSALWVRAWLDPDPVATDKIFGDLIDRITSGKDSPGSAISRAVSELKQAGVYQQ